jgi:hypothetical protein
MDHEADTTTIRVTCEVIRCIAKTLLARAEELERLQDPTQTEPPRPLPHNAALDL